MISKHGRSFLYLLLFFLVLIVAVGLTTDILSPSLASGLGTVVLALVTIIYAMNTEEQVRATRASYAPSLDIQVFPKSDHLELSVANRGEGVAKNIIITIQVDDYKYRGFIDNSLRPNHLLYSKFGSHRNRVSIVPRFYVRELPKQDPERTPPQRILKQVRDASKYFTPVNDANKAILKLDELLAFKYVDGGGFTPSEGQQWFRFKIELDYTDVNGENEFTTSASDYDQIYVPAGGGDLNEILPAGQRGLMILEHPINQFKRTYLSWTRRLPFEENLDIESKRKT